MICHGVDFPPQYFALPLLPSPIVFDGERAQNGAQFAERKYLFRSEASEPDTYAPESSFDSARPTATVICQPPFVPYAKGYDAIVTVRTNIGERKFALEYERTPKAAKCYRAIAAGMSHEVHVNRLLYLVANYDILRFVSGFFTKAVYPSILWSAYGLAFQSG